MNNNNLTNQTSPNHITICVEVPTEYYSTWRSATIFTSIHALYTPSELDEETLQNPFQIIEVIIPVDFMTLSKLEFDLNLIKPSKKQLERALKKYFQKCNAKIRFLKTPDILWQKIKSNH